MGLCYRAHMAANTTGVRLEDQWRDILSVHARTMCEIDRVLHPHGLGASDFEVPETCASETTDPPRSTRYAPASGPCGEARGDRA